MNLAEWMKKCAEHEYGCPACVVESDQCECSQPAALRRAELLEEYHKRASKVILESSFYKFDGEAMAALQETEAALAKEGA